MKMAVDRKLPCVAAGKIAEEPGIFYPETGAAADELGVKINNSPLGCF